MKSEHITLFPDTIESENTQLSQGIVYIFSEYLSRLSI